MTIDGIPFEPCMKDGKGHIHVCLGMNASIQDVETKEVLGKISCDVNATKVILQIGAEDYHISTLDLWNAVSDKLGYSR